MTDYYFISKFWTLNLIETENVLYEFQKYKYNYVTCITENDLVWFHESEDDPLQDEIME